MTRTTLLLGCLLLPMLARAQPTEHLETAKAYRAAIAALVAPDAALDRAMRRADPAKLAQQDGVGAWVEANAPALERALAASARPGCRFIGADDIGPDTRLDHLTGVRQLGRLFALRAERRLTAGEADAGVADLEAALRVGKHVAMDPTVICLLIDVAIESLALPVIDRYLAGGPDPAVCARLRDVLLALESRRVPLARFLEDERRFARATAGQMLDGALAGKKGTMATKEDAVVRGLVGPGLTRDQLRALWLERFAARAKPFYDAQVAAAKVADVAAARALAARQTAEVEGYGKDADAARARLKAEVEALAQLEDQQGDEAARRRRRVATLVLDQYAKVLMAMVLPGFDRLYAREALRLARARLALIGCALAAARGKDDAYPGTLADLGLPAAVLVDPFDGRALRYRVTATGYTLWSVGPDGDDDAAKQRYDERQREAAGDVVRTR